MFAFMSACTNNNILPPSPFPSLGIVLKIWNCCSSLMSHNNIITRIRVLGNSRFIFLIFFCILSAALGHSSSDTNSLEINYTTQLQFILCSNNNLSDGNQLSAAAAVTNDDVEVSILVFKIKLTHVKMEEWLFI